MSSWLTRIYLIEPLFPTCKIKIREGQTSSCCPHSRWVEPDWTFLHSSNCLCAFSDCASMLSLVWNVFWTTWNGFIRPFLFPTATNINIGWNTLGCAYVISAGRIWTFEDAELARNLTTIHNFYLYLRAGFIFKWISSRWRFGCLGAKYVVISRCRCGLPDLSWYFETEESPNLTNQKTDVNKA